MPSTCTCPTTAARSRSGSTTRPTPRLSYGDGRPHLRLLQRGVRQRRQRRGRARGRPGRTKVDTTPPTSAVAALPAISPSSFTLHWSGDDGAGSGVAHYTIYVSDNHGPFTVLLANTTATSASFAGQDSHLYGFASVATDAIGNALPPPTAGPSRHHGRGQVSDNHGPFTVWLSNTTTLSAVYTGIDGHLCDFASAATDSLGNAEPPPTAARPPPRSIRCRPPAALPTCRCSVPRASWCNGRATTVPARALPVSRSTSRTTTGRSRSG